ncbi:chondroitin proteoglycan 2-like [Hydractinia symbiolongicarpus]|uniref:chondroitin proteoglycan 2-like n=1 Tax=Hydractinia symbiolongicarpus TaxID=13093 RepID=UPI00254FE952|nr:chondroitin proteoglycan 2-like [Hydractinia symbiolongicarpus]
MIGKFLFVLLLATALTLNIDRQNVNNDEEVEDFSDDFDNEREKGDNDNEGYEEIEENPDNDNVDTSNDEDNEGENEDENDSDEDDKENDNIVNDENDENDDDVDENDDENDGIYEKDSKEGEGDGDEGDDENNDATEEYHENDEDIPEDNENSEELQQDQSLNTFCSTKNNGNYPDPLKCNGFIQCSNKIGYRQPCPGGLSYNHVKNQCVYPVCSGSGFCTGKADGNYRDQATCNGFISCSNGGTYHMPCPSGLEYSVAKDQCVNSADSDCAKPVSDYEKVIADDEALNQICIGKKDGNYAHPQRCDAFVQCANGFGYRQLCPGGLSYNQGKDQCVFPVCKQAGFCATKNSGNYADPKKCAGFITCANGVTYHMACPAGLHYNSTVDRCENPNNADCKNDCVVAGHRYKPGASFIHPQCRGSCVCNGPSHSCVSLCPPSVPNCGPNGQFETMKVKVTNNPACYCQKTVCKPQ